MHGNDWKSARTICSSGANCACRSLRSVALRQFISGVLDHFGRTAVTIGKRSRKEAKTMNGELLFLGSKKFRGSGRKL